MDSRLNGAARGRNGWPGQVGTVASLQGLEVMTEHERQLFLETIHVYARKRDWRGALDRADFRYSKKQGELFPCNDEKYFREYIYTFGLGVASHINACHLNYMQELERVALRSKEGAELYVRNFLICYYFAEYMAHTQVEFLRVRRNVGFINYRLQVESGMVLCGAVKKLNDSGLWHEVLSIRNVSYVKAVDVLQRLVQEYPDDLKSRVRLQRLMEISGERLKFEQKQELRQGTTSRQGDANKHKPRFWSRNE